MPSQTSTSPTTGKTERRFNFAAGPAALPLSVLEEAQRDLLCLPGAGASILEISHRSPQFSAILDEARANLRALLALPDDFQVLFLQGGASLQFSMVPMNLLRSAGGEPGSADYVVTGAWGAKALQEARREGSARVAWSGEDEGYVRVPNVNELRLDPEARYLHLTSNETIQGVEFPDPPFGIGFGAGSASVPLVCDISSDFLSRPIDASRYGLLYAGAQKNAGPAGVTVVLVRQSLLAHDPGELPTMLDYRVHAAKGSVYNTPPVFAIYLLMLVTRWLRDTMGGLAAVAAHNRAKAARLYARIDDSDGFYRGHAQPASRSMMNVTWRLPSEELERRFLAAATERGLDGLKGHRSVGGLRASIYNAVPDDGVDALAALMDDFRAAQ
jgi:phosphoserine aminotransferase